jgi:hypothetical protein
MLDLVASHIEGSHEVVLLLSSTSGRPQRDNASPFRSSLYCNATLTKQQVYHKLVHQESHPRSLRCFPTKILETHTTVDTAACRPPATLTNVRDQATTLMTMLK